MNIQPLDIIVTRNNNPVSWWIRWRSVSRWSHVCLGGRDGTIFTTSAFGFKRVEAEEYLKNTTFAVYRMPLTDKEVESGMELCRQQLGGKYGYSDILSMVMQNLKGRGISKLNKNSKNFFCSEFTAWLYKQIGIKLQPKVKHWSAFTPEDCVLDERLELIITNDEELFFILKGSHYDPSELDSHWG